jgi:hypothetical protein
MKKNRIIIVALCLLALLALVLYFIFRDNTERKTIEFNFITDHPIANDGGKLPAEMRVFCSVFDITEQKTILFPRLSFQRLDQELRVDTLQFSKPITSELSREDADLMYTNETNTMLASVMMYKEKSDNEPRDFQVFTEKFCHFYLVPKSDGRVDGIRYFDNPISLRNYITSKLIEGTLFLADQKQNVINIILLSGASEEIDQEVPDNTEIQEGPNVPEGPAAKSYPANLKASGNTFNWSKDLKTANKLTIVFKSKVDGKILIREDVTGLSSYYFSYSNSNYEASPIEVRLEAEWGDGSKMTGGSLVTSELQCH